MEVSFASHGDMRGKPGAAARSLLQVEIILVRRALPVRARGVNGAAADPGLADGRRGVLSVNETGPLHPSYLAAAQ
jgi:hypothetical protein